MIKFFKRAEKFCFLLSLFTIIGYNIYGHIWTENLFWLILIYAVLIGVGVALPFYLVFQFLFKCFVKLGIVKPDELEVGEEIFEMKVVETSEEELDFEDVSYRKEKGAGTVVKVGVGTAAGVAGLKAGEKFGKWMV